MWSAFMNGSGLHGGGGAGGGYVPSQGWEFVPCARMERADRGRGKSRSPLRRISSPPTVFSQIYEPAFSASPGGGGGGGGDGGTGTQLEILRGQMWPGPEAPQQQQQQQQQSQHARLKKKFEDLKKRHVQDKEEWLREKESLLREVADIQGGENRRILLDLKTVLEEVQAEVKREEEKRSELQLLYTRDRCAWELEKSELKCRIAQLEARDVAGVASGGAQAAGGPGGVASRSPREQHGETSTLRREREEQRRILADTQSAAMDLRCRLEHSERDWLKEKAELLERFEGERREWENQLKDMQKKIEELYCEVRVKQAATGLAGGRRDEDEDVAHRLSIRSTSTGSSLLSDNTRSEPLSSSSQSEPPGRCRQRNFSGDGGRAGCHSACFPAESLCEFNIGAQFNEHVPCEHAGDVRPTEDWERDADRKGRVDPSGLDAALFGDAGCRVSPEFAPKNREQSVHASPQESQLWAQLSYSSDKKKNTTALNAALKEIARVSEELCSYQDEIRKKSGEKRSRCESMCAPEEVAIRCGDNKTCLEAEEAPCDLNQIYDDLRALQRENWITLSPSNTWQASRAPTESWTTVTADPDSNRGMQTSPGASSEMDPAAPPVPPRSSSWNLSAPTQSDTELHIPDSPVTTVRKCHSPCVLVDRKCSSPSIVRKFEAMLQENEGKVFVDGVVASCSVPANSKCNMGCCHSRWSCDASKFTNAKLSAYGTVQKSFSEVNIRSAGKDLVSDYCAGVGNLKSSELQMPPFVRELPVDLLLSSLETVPLSSNLKGSKRNIMLEQKTAEFNRTLFQAEMGRGVEDLDRCTATDICSVGHIPVPTASHEALPPKGTDPQPYHTDGAPTLMDVPPELTLSLFVSDPTVESPEVQAKWMSCATELEELQIQQEPSSVVSPSQAGRREAAASSQNPVLHREVKHKVQTASSPTRKTPHRAATEAPFSEAALPANILPAQSADGSSPKTEDPHGARPQPAKAAVSLQQLSAENKQRQTTQPRHSSDTSRPGPRMMNDHPWKPLTLAAYPRPEGSRSNYGAVERILRNYEDAARAQQTQGQESHAPSSSKFSVKQEENVIEPDPALSPPTLRHAQTSQSTETHTAHVQLSSHSATSVREIQLLVQEDEEPPVSPSAVQRIFPRPARPANRRLPSRWASRSPPPSSSTPPSPSSTPVVPPTFPQKKHSSSSSSFSYSHSFHIETVII